MSTVEEKLYLSSQVRDVVEVSCLLRKSRDQCQLGKRRRIGPMDSSSNYGHVEVVKLLLAHPDINVNSKTRNGKTPPFKWLSALPCVCGPVLLKDFRVDVTLDDGSGHTPLWWASWDGRREVIECLIASGRVLGDVKNKKGNFGWNEKGYAALEIASSGKLFRCLKDSCLTQHEPGTNCE